MKRFIVIACLVSSFGLQAETQNKLPRVKPSAAAIASAHHLATEAGHEILAKGGNAFDAAIAVSAVLSVVEPVSSGLGGGGFFLLHDAKTGRDVMVDARETSPEKVTSADYLDAKGELDRDRAINGPWSAAIPGLPAAFVHIQKKYGRLPLSVSLAPAIRIANNGFPLYPRLVESYAGRKQVMERYAGTRAVYLADGDVPELGELLVQKDLANTLQAIADHGFDGFYQGDVARNIVQDVIKEGGVWTLQDLANYRVKERVPVRIRYRDWDIVTAPPPSSGGVAIAQILQIMEAWDLKKITELQRVHLLTEAMRRAYRDRTLYLGDPDFIDVPVARLTSDDYAAGLRASIHPEKATPSDLLPGGKAPQEGGHTTHFSIIDQDGNFVATTQTVNLPYGSGMIAQGTGILLNNEMDDFALRPGTPNAFGVIGFDANAIAPGKRMLSSMSPTFMLSKDRVAVLGTPGGSRIITMVLLGILGVEAGLDPQQVTAIPRFHHQYLPDRISYEPGAFSPELIKALEAAGHATQAGKDTWGNMQAVDWNLIDNTLRGGTDPRNAVGKAEVKAQKRRQKSTDK